MQVDNQTLTTIIHEAIKSSIIPDYFGWALGITGVLLGIVGIYITIAVYRKQTNLSNQLDVLQQYTVKNSQNSIMSFFSDFRINIEYQQQQVEMKKTPDEKNSEIRDFISICSKSYQHDLTDMDRNIDYLRGKIDIELFEDMEKVAKNIYSFTDEKVIENTNAVGTIAWWTLSSDDVLENMDKLSKKLST